MDPDTIQIRRYLIRMDLLPYWEGGSMIPVDLRQTVSVGSIPNLNGSGIRSRDPFSGSTDMSAADTRHHSPEPLGF